MNSDRQNFSMKMNILITATKTFGGIGFLTSLLMPEDTTAMVIISVIMFVLSIYLMEDKLWVRKKENT